MKRIVSLIFITGIFVSGFTQSGKGLLTLQLSTVKTTTLIFPYPILHVDRGDRDILVQPVSEAGNILLIKAATDSFRNTNLTVVTADKAVYSFNACYNPAPTGTVFQFEKQRATVSSDVSDEKNVMNLRDMENYSKGILDNDRFIRGITNKNGDVSASVSGVYIHGNVMFFQVSIENTSPIDYDINFIRFFIRDKRQVKRTASQEQEITPLYAVGNRNTVYRQSGNTIVFAVEKFTVPDAKHFFIQIGEKNGGRHLQLKVRNGKLLKAKVLPSYY